MSAMAIYRKVSDSTTPRIQETYPRSETQQCRTCSKEPQMPLRKNADEDTSEG